jgi:hypothetical protein
MNHSLRIGSTRVFIAAVAASVAAASAAWSVDAKSGTGTQNPELTVYVSITPACITPGGIQTRVFSVTNHTRQGESVTLGWVLTYNGKVFYTAPPRNVVLRPHQVWFDPSGNWTGPSYPSQGLGTYTETRSATDGVEGTSSATATYTFANSCP